jgi:predicted transposase YbfD/YdcC
VKRLTIAQQIELSNETDAFEFFREALAKLPDPRRAQGRRYPLQTVVVSALIGMVCGCDNAVALELWSKANAKWLSEFLEVPHGTPTQDVYLSVFAALDTEAFKASFRAWAEFLRVRLASHGKHVAIDGKTSRGSIDRGNDKPAIHTVSAWLSGFGLVLAQQKTDAKSNEITAIPEVLKVLDLRGMTVTIDAMGCQTPIAAQIIDGGGDYILGVKDNQPSLAKAAKETFADVDEIRQRSVDEGPAPQVDEHKTVDKGHGRIEERVVRVCKDLRFLEDQERWPGLSAFVEVWRRRTNTVSGKVETQTSYYIASDAELTAAKAAKTIRDHWQVENNLHWVLDVAFGEDRARHRAQNAASNFTVLRHFVLNLVKSQRGRKVGVANTRQWAGFDRNVLLNLLCGANS